MLEGKLYDVKMRCLHGSSQAHQPRDELRLEAVTGLPDGFLSYQKIPIWVYFGGP
jgi:hypothetical protein